MYSLASNVNYSILLYKWRYRSAQFNRRVLCILYKSNAAQSTLFQLLFLIQKLNQWPGRSTSSNSQGWVLQYPTY